MKVLWIAFIWPEPASSAAGLRSFQLINTFLASGDEIRVCSPCQHNKYQDQLTELKIPNIKLEPNDPRFDDYILEYQPDLVIFDRFMIEEQFSWRVRKHCPHALRVLDTVDLHLLRRAREAQLKSKQSDASGEATRWAVANTMEDSELLSETAFREIAAIYRSDLSYVLSDFEQRLLQDFYKIPAELVKLNRIFYDAAINRHELVNRKDFVTIGNFNHPPNVDAFRLLHQELWKKIREKFTKTDRPAPELHIYGAYPSDEFIKLDNPTSGFRVKGWANDAQETIARYRVNLAPLRFGAGIKGKVADGWRVGTPCVATSISAEGMHESLPFGGFATDSWDNFADKAFSLYTDRQVWELSRKNGERIINELFNEELNSKKFRESIDAIKADPETRRTKNFVGAMLWHHQHRSTEFFSRWIEEKNRPSTKEKG